MRPQICFRYRSCWCTPELLDASRDRLIIGGMQHLLCAMQSTAISDLVASVEMYPWFTHGDLTWSHARELTPAPCVLMLDRYIEKYEKEEDKLDQVPSEALAGLVALGLKLSQLRELTGRENPTVIT